MNGILVGVVYLYLSHVTRGEILFRSVVPYFWGQNSTDMALKGGLLSSE